MLNVLIAKGCRVFPIIFGNFALTNYCIAFVHNRAAANCAAFHEYDNFSHLCRRWSGTAQDRECEQTHLFFFSRRIWRTIETNTKTESTMRDTVVTAVNDWVLATNGALLKKKEKIWFVRGILFIRFLSFNERSTRFVEIFILVC